jgi:hypothetical protein
VIFNVSRAALYSYAWRAQGPTHANMKHVEKHVSPQKRLSRAIAFRRRSSDDRMLLIRDCVPQMLAKETPTQDKRFWAISLPTTGNSRAHTDQGTTQEPSILYMIISTLLNGMGTSKASVFDV